MSKQAVAAGIGITLMIIISKIDYKKYGPFYKIIYVLSILTLLLVVIPGLGRTVNEARRWINIPVFGSFQPSELTKIGLIIFFSYYITKNKDNIASLKNGFIKTFLYTLVPIAILVGIQSHLSASIVILAVVSIIMMVAGSKIKHFLTAGLGIGRLRYRSNVSYG